MLPVVLVAPVQRAEPAEQRERHVAHQRVAGGRPREAAMASFVARTSRSMCSTLRRAGRTPERRSTRNRARPIKHPATTAPRTPSFAQLLASQVSKTPASRSSARRDPAGLPPLRTIAEVARKYEPAPGVFLRRNVTVRSGQGRAGRRLGALARDARRQIDHPERVAGRLEHAELGDHERHRCASRSAGSRSAGRA